MSLDEPASKPTPVEITEGLDVGLTHQCALSPHLDNPPPLFFFPDEAALYDRQIRLWGLEAQQRCVLPKPLARHDAFVSAVALRVYSCMSM